MVDPATDERNFFEQDSNKRFLKAYKVLPEMIRAAREFVKHTSFNHEKIQSFPPSGFLGAPRLAGFRAVKVYTSIHYIEVIEHLFYEQFFVFFKLDKNNEVGRLTENEKAFNMVFNIC